MRLLAAFNAGYLRSVQAMTFACVLYRVEGKSMLPTLCAGDYLLVRECMGSKRRLARGDIIVLAEAGGSQLKRIVALPREQVAFADGMFLIDGKRLEEPYLQGLPPYLGLGESRFELGIDEYFVMGDNRVHSTDSRHYGAVHRSQIYGRVVCRVWPLFRFGKRR